MEEIGVDYKNRGVFVCCLTYNQARFIKDTFHGFVIQETDFPFLCLVIDDNSNDGEQSVILDWLNDECDMSEAVQEDNETYVFVKARHKANMNCTFVVYLLKQNYYSQRKSKSPFLKPWRDLCAYEALCEGDDYWTDPKKLQRQVDYLEAHEDCSMCFHNAMIHYEDSDAADVRFSNIEDRDYAGVEIYKNWIVPTASVMMRKPILDSSYYNKLAANKNFAYGDIILFISCAEQGVIHGLPEVMCVYRRQSTSYSYVAPMLPRIRHHYEVFNTIGGAYRETAGRIVLSLGIPQVFLNITKPRVSLDILRMCFGVSMLKTIVKVLSFPFLFTFEKLFR